MKKKTLSKLLKRTAGLGSLLLLLGALSPNTGLGQTPAPVSLVNIDFSGNQTASPEVGPAATGQTSTDFWNYFECWWNDFGQLSGLKNADGSVTAVSVLVNNAPGLWGNGSSDPMFNDYIYPFDDGNVTVTLSNMPAGSYDLYLYANDGDFEVASGGVSYGTKQSFQDPVVNPPSWQAGVQYAHFHSVQVANDGDLVVVTVRPGVYGYAIISGLQIVPGTPEPSPCTPPPSGMISWWRGDGNALDSIGNNHGTLVGATCVPGFVNYTFDVSSQDYVNVPHSSTLNPPNAFTVECWINRQAIVGTWDPVVKKAGSGSSQTDGYSLEFSGSNILFYVYTGSFVALTNTYPPISSLSKITALTYNGGGYAWRASSSARLELGQWYHVAGVYNGSTVRLYVNGSPVGWPASAPGNFVGSSNPLRIGNDPSNPSRFFDGFVDEVSLYNRALTTTEIQAIYTAGRSGKCH